jgi:F-type H+-transporting ATPase subunit epsilon
MNIEIVSPEKIIYSGAAEVVTVPGLSSSFSVLDRHAPIISALDKGEVRYNVNGKDKKVIINGGFIEVKKNIVSICIE